MLILVMAANTSFADFPRLASYHAGDSFLPRQLTKRGHRLVLSNGIVALAVASVAMVVVTGAEVDRPIPLYAVGVFTSSFTLSQAGMARHHLRLREPGWRRGLVINASGAALTLVVDAIIILTKFTHGAWTIVVAVPVLVALLVRLGRRYAADDAELAHEARQAACAPVMRRHVALVLVGALDRAAARAIQFGRSLNPTELRAVHVAADPIAAARSVDEWHRLELGSIPLEVVECPDRRITRVVLEVVSEVLADGDAEVSLLIPRLEHRRSWHRLLHDRTSDAIAHAVATLPHANVTFVPYHLGRSSTEPPAVPGGLAERSSS